MVFISIFRYFVPVWNDDNNDNNDNNNNNNDNNNNNNDNNNNKNNFQKTYPITTNKSY